MAQDGHRRNGRGLDPQDIRREMPPRESRFGGGAALVIRPPAFGTDQHRDARRRGRGYRRHVALGVGDVRDQTQLRGALSHDLGERRGRIDLHQPRAAALLGRLQRDALEAFELAAPGIDHAALGDDRDEPIRPEFRRFLHEHRGAVALGHGHGQVDARAGRGELASRSDLDAHRAPDRLHGGVSRAAPAVEDFHFAPGAQAEHAAGVVDLFSVEFDG